MKFRNLVFRPNDILHKQHSETSDGSATADILQCVSNIIFVQTGRKQIQFPRMYLVADRKHVEVK